MSKRVLIRRDAIRSCSRQARPTAGFTLIELMIAMLLGLIVVAGVVSVFLANQRSYRTNEALADVQDGSRISFELMARDIRDAGLNGCDNSGRIGNVLINGPVKGGTDWWANWANAVHGYDSTQTDPAAGSRAAKTDSLQLLGVSDIGVSVATNTPTAGQFTLNGTATDLTAGDVLIVCDPNHAAIFQSSAFISGSTTLTYAASGTPGNCNTGLGYPSSCTTANNYQFLPNAQLGKLTAADWYVGANGVGGTSLYRLALVNTTGSIGTQAQEMVRNVTDMQITYHQAGSASFLAADTVTNWASVDAVQVTLTLESNDTNAGTNAASLERHFTATTTVRNRVN